MNYSTIKLPSMRQSDIALDGPPPKIQPTVCKYCKKIYDDFNIYTGFCSFTCRARYNKKINPKPKRDQYDEGDY